MMRGLVALETPPASAESPPAFRHRRYLGFALGLALIVAGNHFVRHYLEHQRLPAYSVFPDDKVPLSWRLLLPYDIGAHATAVHVKGCYHWFTTGMTVVKLSEECATPNTVFYALNALLIVSSFVCTWLMFRSAVFSYTVALCMAFGTHFHWVYVCSSLAAFYLYVVYVQVNLLCLSRVLRTGARRWQVGFAVSLVLIALNHEQWLDYLGFLLLACVFLWLYAGRAGLPELRPRVLFVAACSALIAALYLGIRLQYGGQQSHPGDESEMIFNYGSRVLAVEDFISNVFTYLYIACSNYFPPCLVSSNSLYQLGPQGVLAEQHGYHAGMSHLVAMHHVFYWYFFAGIVFTLFVYFFVRSARAALLQGSPRAAHLTLFMLLIVTGFAIHALVKYRPYMSVPLLGYKCTTSQVGVAYLLAYCLMHARHVLPSRWLSRACIALVWGVIVYGALARPAYLSHLSRQVGMINLPDPLTRLR
jgi:hypothetical protein